MASLQADLQEALAPFSQHLGLLIRNNQLSRLSPIWARPDVQAVLGASVRDAASRAADAVSAAWDGPQGSYATALFRDLAATWEAAPAVIAQAAQRAFSSVPQGHFEVGVSIPGTSPVIETAAARAQAVTSAVADAAAGLAARTQLSAAVASTRSGAESVLAEGALREAAGEQMEKEWVARIDLPNVCVWCRALHGTRVGLHEEFPSGEPIALPHAHTRHVATASGQARYHLGIGAPIILTHPPQVYHNLLGPPRHPRCRCGIRLVPAGGTGTPAPPAPHQYISSDTIKALPEERYQALTGFLRAALHELGMVIRRLLHLG